jgi:diguanylate cyclase (GGDEF)-like protein
LAPQAPTPDPARTEDEALDTIAAVLRVLAQTARTSEAAEVLGAWAQHLLVLTPAPAPEGAEPGVRQWSFARTAAVVHVRKEAAATERGLSDLQDVIWAIVESTARIVEDDARLDGRAAACVDRLRSAVGQPPELLRRAALEAVTELADVLNARATRLTPVDGGLADRIATLSAQLDAARREAELDAVTDLAARRALDRELSRAACLHKLSRDPLCLLLVDLDEFKSVNDRHGHVAGDDALRLVSRELTRAFPRSCDFIGRFGGDEFGVILRYVDSTDAERLANRFLEALRERPLETQGGPVRITASVGVSELGPGDTAATAMQRADVALYEAKARGRDRVVVAPPHQDS